MSEKNCLIIADPLEKFQREMDSTLLLIQELLSRNYSCFYLNIRALSASDLNEDLLKKLPCEKILSCDPQKENFLRLEKKQNKTLTDFTLCLHRLDPPVDDFYKKYCTLFSYAPKEVFQVNQPSALAELSEHLLPLDYPQDSIPTLLPQSFEEFYEALKKRDTCESVAKPIHECSGIGVRFFSHTTEKLELENYWQEFEGDIILQPYRSEIENSGDLRVLCIGSVFLGAVLRKAAPGKRLSNLHQGGSAHAFELTPKQKEITARLGPLLHKRGLYFCGLDFIGDEISEINFTSPTCLTFVNELYKTRVEKTLVDEILKICSSPK